MTFYLCERSLSDPDFPKYPRIPVIECRSYEPRRYMIESALSAYTRKHAGHRQSPWRSRSAVNVAPSNVTLSHQHWPAQQPNVLPHDSHVFSRTTIGGLAVVRMLAGMVDQPFISWTVAPS